MMRRRTFITGLGAAAAWPLAVRGQQATPVIGFVHQGPPEPLSLMNAFRAGLGEAGLADNRDFSIENRWANGHYDRLPGLAADLVKQRVAVIAAAFLPAALAAKAATQTIPIVFLSGSDPIGAGLVPSINRPSANVTGIAPMFTLLGTKNLELINELAPSATVIGALANPSNPNSAPQLKDLEAGARALGRKLIAVNAASDDEIDAAFAGLAGRGIGALLVTADGYLIGRQDRLVELAARYAVPTIYPLSNYVAAGGLISYGANLSDAYRQTGIYVGRILRGANPTDLPVLQPTKIELVINLKTAKALGLTVPPSLLAIADEVIE